MKAHFLLISFCFIFFLFACEKEAEIEKEAYENQVISSEEGITKSGLGNPGAATSVP